MSPDYRVVLISVCVFKIGVSFFVLKATFFT
jgi:hypothetical protein